MIRPRLKFRLMLTAVLLAAPAVASPPSERYVNEKYSLSFALPHDASVCRSTAPLPNHGLLFRPKGVSSPPCSGDIEAGTRYTSADAHFDVDGTITPANFVSSECPQLAYDSQGAVTSIKPPAIPSGNLRWVACRINGSDGSIQEILFARRGATADTPPIDYTLALKTTSQNYKVDRAAFIDWLGTISLAKPVALNWERPNLSINGTPEIQRSKAGSFDRTAASYEAGEPSQRMPEVGSCFTTKVREVTSRLEGVRGSGTTVLYADGHAQVSYDQIAAADQSHRQDPVTLCVVSTPKDCPSGDFRGVVYRAVDQRNHRSWVLPNAEHSCGGA